MTFDEMRTALDMLAGLKFRPDNYKTHWLGLRDMNLDDLTAAVELAAMRCKEFPSPAELRGLAPRERLCQYGHTPPCDTSSACTKKMLADARVKAS